MIAIKQLGTNGGGFYISNSAVPFENPNRSTNSLEVIAILLIPVAQAFMFGRMVPARRHAWMVFAMFAIGVGIAFPTEQHGSQVLRDSGVNITQGHGQSGGKIEGALHCVKASSLRRDPEYGGGSSPGSPRPA